MQEHKLCKKPIRSQE